ncbi:hypothetical protein ACFL4W_01395 [Planctomycetota bacterium]
MEPKPLSSQITFFFNRFIPFMIVGSFAFTFLTVPAEKWPAMLLLAFIPAGLIGLFWLLGILSARQVWMGEKGLIIKTFGGPEEIPFSDIERVDERTWINPPVAVIRLRKPGPLGDRIYFIPPVHFRFGFNKGCPEVDMLRERVKQAQTVEKLQK